MLRLFGSKTVCFRSCIEQLRWLHAIFGLLECLRANAEHSNKEASTLGKNGVVVLKRAWRPFFFFLQTVQA